MVSSFARAGRRVFRRSGMKKRVSYRRRASTRRSAPRRISRKRIYRQVRSRVPGRRLFALRR